MYPTIQNTSDLVPWASAALLAQVVLPRGMEPASVDVARSIRRRSAQVLQMGEHVGFWEWVVWSFMRDVSVLMLFGSDVVDVRVVFGPASVAPTRGIHRVAAVMLAANGSYRSAVAPDNRGHVPVSNHFLVGTTKRGVVDVVATGPPAIHLERCAVRAAMKVGWVLSTLKSWGTAAWMPCPTTPVW